MSRLRLRQAPRTFLFYFRSKPQLCEVECSSLQYMLPSGFLAACVKWSTESVAFTRGLVVKKVGCFGVLSDRYAFTTVRF